MTEDYLSKASNALSDLDKLIDIGVGNVSHLALKERLETAQSALEKLASFAQFATLGLEQAFKIMEEQDVDGNGVNIPMRYLREDHINNLRLAVGLASKQLISAPEKMYMLQRVGQQPTLTHDPEVVKKWRHLMLPVIELSASDEGTTE